jgi:hypothetical protein
MVSEAFVMAPPELASITDVTNNSLSSVAYTEFLNGGAVAYIPAGVKNLDLASLGQDPNLTLNFNELSELRGFTFVIGSDTYEVAVSENTVNSLRDHGHLADYLNNGFMTATKKNSSGATIATGLGLK